MNGILDNLALGSRGRRGGVLLAGLLLATGAGTVLSAAPGATTANCATSSPTGAYSVKVCVTAPASGTTVSGDVPVAATVTVTGTSPGVAKTFWTIDNQLLLTDFANPYGFTLHSADFADATVTIRVVAKLRDGETSSATTLRLTLENGNDTTPVNPNSWSPPQPPEHPWGEPMTMAAVGDGAGGEVNATNVVNLMSGWNPELFLYLGDVYEDGTLTEFRNWYGTDGAWFDRFRSITAPVIGNHETDGGGYWSYWDNIGHYYSFDANGWHFVALDSTSQFDETSPSSDQYRWLAADLAANPSPCTIVFAHHPLYNIGKEDPALRMTDMWKLMAQNHVTLYLTGHDHTYQRWVPMSASGASDPTGVAELVVGTGGHSSQAPLTSDSRVVVKAKAYGASRFDLYGDHADLTFSTAAGDVLDQSRLGCQGHDGLAPLPASGLAGVPGNSGVALTWSAGSDNFGVTEYDVYRDGVLIGSTAGTSYSDGAVSGAGEHSYWVVAVDAAGNRSPASVGVTVDLGAPDTTPPTAPTGLTGTVAADQSVDLQWVAATDNQDVHYYTVWRDGAAAGTTTSTSYHDQPAWTSEAIHYWVTATDAAGNESGPSDEVVVTTGDTTPPGPPGDLAATADSPNRVRLTWTPASDNVGVAGYRIARDGLSVGAVDGSTLSFTDGAVLSGSTHTWSVVAVDGEGLLSSEASVTFTAPEAFPRAPVGDTWVNSDSPATSYSTQSLLRSDASPVQRPYLLFDLSNVTGQVVRARLRVYANTKSTTPVTLYRTADGWTEAGLTWNSAPPPNAWLDDTPAWGAPGWVTFDLDPSTITGTQLSLMLDTTSATSATYASKEGGTPAQLLLDVFDQG
ncbi:MAG TPA: DNRLRE domain-containing protein [Nocardioides sp.]